MAYQTYQTQLEKKKEMKHVNMIKKQRSSFLFCSHLPVYSLLLYSQGHRCNQGQLYSQSHLLCSILLCRLSHFCRQGRLLCSHLLPCSLLLCSQSIICSQDHFLCSQGHLCSQSSLLLCSHLFAASSATKAASPEIVSVKTLKRSGLDYLQDFIYNAEDTIGVFNFSVT